MTRVLVVGARGFLGSHVVTALEGDRRIAAVHTPRRDQLDPVAMSADEIAHTVRAHGVDVVVSCAGRMDGTGKELVTANTLSAATLLDAAGIHRFRLVRIGSAGEYGPVAAGRPVSEQDPAHPVGGYGVTHLAATQLLEAAHRTGTVEATSLRVFNPVGPRMAGATVLGRATAQLQEAVATGAESIRLGPLSAYRDFVDVRDVGSAVVAAALASEPAPVVNVAGGRAHLVRDAVRSLAKQAGFTGQILEAEPAQARSRGVDWIQADISLAREALGWRPDYTLADSLTQVWGRGVLQPAGAP